MFYKKGIDITNDRQMFEFLKGHFEYPTMSSWNQMYSIANNVKLYKLGLSGDWSTALSHLENGEYDTISYMIDDWRRCHPGYEVYFNGRSGGYLVLYNADNNRTVLPDEVDYNDDYEGYKEMCREYFGSVKAARYKLVEMVKLVQDFDRLCDQLRDYVNELSTQDFAARALERTVDLFNENYYDDLAYLGYSELVVVDGKVGVKTWAMLEKYN